jgi:hypothetical protein
MFPKSGEIAAGTFYRFEITHLADVTVILRSRALARRLEGSPRAFVAHPLRLAVKNGEHLSRYGEAVTRG